LIWRDAERDSDKPACTFSSTGLRLPCQIDFNDAVLKISFGQNYESTFITEPRRSRIVHAQSFSTFERDSLCLHIHQL